MVSTDLAFDNAALNAAKCPAEVMRIIAQSLHREMANAGFGSNEIIALLSNSLQQHSWRALPVSPSSPARADNLSNGVLLPMTAAPMSTLDGIACAHRVTLRLNHQRVI